MARRAALRDVGSEPDPRFTLANERTFLAQARTSLALLATGVAIAEFLPGQERAVRLAIGLPLVLAACVLAALSYRHWEATERALRVGRPLPYSPVAPILAGTMALVAVAVTLALLTRG